MANIGKMELEEIFMSQFTTATSCYSGARHCNNKDDNSIIRLATENHVLGIKLGNHPDPIETTCEVIPRDAPSIKCVGFSQHDQDVMALALVDSSEIDQTEHETTPPIFYPNDSDAMSVVSNAYSIPDSSSVGRGGYRRPSGSASSTLTTPTTLSTSTNTSHTRSKSDVSYHEAPNNSNRNEADVNDVSPKLPEARLFFFTPEEYFCLVDFRPLCPCVAKLGEKGKIGVWVGSAEDAVLRWYIPKPANHQLELQTLPEDHFVVDSPVMGLDFHSKEDYSTLAVACQDGTIQLISWKGENFQDVHSFKVIVDGPLVCLQLQEYQGFLRVVVGSLCGYVCQLVRKGNNWEGPSMIVQGLRDESIVAEDSVLVVHSFGDYVAIGTHSGRCQLYKVSGKRYFKVWECRLPYSVHGLVAVASLGNPFTLIVTTRRSLHVFQGSDVDTETDTTTNYSAELAKQRLLHLLEVSRTPATPSKPSTDLPERKNSATDEDQPRAVANEPQPIEDQEPYTEEARDEDSAALSTALEALAEPEGSETNPSQPDETKQT